MVTVTPEMFITNIQPGNIYYFSSEQLNGNTEPHYFITLKNTEDELIFFSCCTTQMDRRLRFIQKTGSPMSTLVGIEPSNENGLRRESYVDCNNVIQHTHDDISKLFVDGEIEFKGELEDDYLQLIYAGINDSILLEAELQDLLSPD